MQFIKRLKKMAWIAVFSIPLIANADTFFSSVAVINTNNQTFYGVLNGQCFSATDLEVFYHNTAVRVVPGILNNFCANAINNCPFELHLTSCSGSLVTTITLDANQGITGYTPPTNGVVLKASGFFLSIS